MGSGQEQTVEQALREEQLRYLDLPATVNVEPGTPLREVIDLMKENATGCVMICSGGRPRGIFTERDYLYKVAETGVDRGSPIDDFMSTELKTLSPEDRLGDAIELMTRGGYRHIPLVDPKGLLAGLISARNIVDYIVEHFPAEVRNLPPKLDQAPEKPDGA